MPTLAAVIFCALVRLQDDPARQAPDLVEKLRSDNVEEREEATRKLRALGRQALPTLAKATEDRDGEVAARAGRLLVTIPIAECLSAKLVTSIPGIVDRLADGGDHAWTEALMEAVSDREGKLLHPTLQGMDLEGLAGRAIRGAVLDEEKARVCGILGKHQVRGAIPDLMPLLKVWNSVVKEAAAKALVVLDAKGVTPELLVLLRDDDHDTRLFAVVVIRGLQLREVIPDVIKLLGDGRPGVQVSAIRLLTAIDATESLSSLATLLRDGSATVRAETCYALARLGTKDMIEHLRILLTDSDPTVRRQAQLAIERLEAIERSK